MLLGGADAADACGWRGLEGRVRLPLGPGPGARIPSPYRPHQWGETGDTGTLGRMKPRRIEINRARASRAHADCL